jgi:hypothetical protein
MNLFTNILSSETGDAEADEEKPSEEERLLRASCFRVMKTSCKNCLFSAKKLVDEARKTEILQECEQEGRFFTCHVASQRGQVVCCRAFFNRYKNKLPMLRLAQILAQVYPDSLRFVEMEESNGIL